MKIYQIDSSARKEGSTSRQLSKKLLNKIKKPGDEIIYRDLDDEMLFISKLTESGMKIPLEKQTEDHKKMFELSDKWASPGLFIMIAFLLIINFNIFSKFFSQ